VRYRDATPKAPAVGVLGALIVAALQGGPDIEGDARPSRWLGA
jgi:hypothetical protein